MDEVLKDELKTFNIDYEKKDEGFVEVTCKNEKELVEKTLTLLTFSRSLTNIHLKLAEGKNLKKLNFVLDSLKKENLDFSLIDEDFKKIQLKEIKKQFETKFKSKVNLDSQENIPLNLFDEEEDGYILAIDLIGFDLTKRGYKIRTYEDSLSPLIVTYITYLLNIDESKKHSFLDSNAQLGDILIELSLLTPRVPLFQKEKRSTPLSKLFKLPFSSQPIPKQISTFTGFVESSKEYSFFKENNVFSGRKVKLSAVDLDWLDVKFHRGDIDYMITQFPYFENEEEKNAYEKDFFYQAEFVTKQKIAIITEAEVNEEFLTKYELKIERKEEIECVGEEYLIYIIGHDVKKKKVNK